MGNAFKFLPKNYLEDWGEFESWALGAGSAPDGWLTATNASVSQETTNIKFGVYSASITASNGSEGGIYRTIPNGSDYAGRTFKLGCWAKSASTGPFIRLSDGVSSSTVHVDGSNALVELTTPSFQLNSSATEIRVDLYASAGDSCVFDSVVLCEGDRLFTVLNDSAVVSNYEPSLNYDNDNFNVAQEEGQIIPEVILRNRPVRLSGTVIGTDVISAQTHFDNLMKSVTSSRRDETVNLYINDSRLSKLFLRSARHRFANSMNFIYYDMSFENPKGVSQGIGKLRTRQVISGTVTEFNLSYSGDILSRPVVSIIADQGGAITTCTLENLTIGESFSYTGTVPSGVALDIDCALGSVENSSINKIADFSGDFLAIIRGTNYFKFTGSNCTINIDYFERFV